MWLSTTRRPPPPSRRHRAAIAPPSRRRNVMQRITHLQPGRVVERVLEYDRVSDARVLVRPTVAVGVDVRELLHHLEALCDDSEKRILVVEMVLAVRHSDEELRAIRVWAAVGH